MKAEILYKNGKPVGYEIEFESKEEKEKYLKTFNHFQKMYVKPILEQLNENRKD